MKKRLLSTLLALCMVLTMMPAAFAADTDLIPADNNTESIVTEPSTESEEPAPDEETGTPGSEEPELSTEPDGSEDKPFTTVAQYNAAIADGDFNGKDVYLTIRGEEGDPIIFGTEDTSANTRANDSTHYETFKPTNTQKWGDPPKLHLTLEWCEFYGNTAGDTGNSSFMYLPNCQSLTINNCKFDAGTSGLKYGINWNLCGIQDSVVSITNSTFTGKYEKNALKLNQRNGADDAATDVKPTDGEAMPASIASATIKNCTFSGEGAVIQLGSQGKGKDNAAAPSTGAFPVEISYVKTGDCEGATEVKVELAYLAADNAEIPTVELSAGETAFKRENGDLIPADTQPVAEIGEDKYLSLESAVLMAGEESTIKLLDNVALTDGIEIDKAITLDLNGKTIEKANDGWTEDTSVDYLLAVKRGGDLTIEDSAGSGKIDAGDLVCGVKMTIKGEAETGDDAVLTVNGGTIQGKYYGISGNGTRHGTKITINGGSITATDSTGTAIYHPQNGSLTVNGGEITSSNTAIEIRSGSLTVTGGTITGGSGTAASTANGGGTTTSNAAVAIAQHTTKKPITVNITGGTLSGGAALYESDPNNIYSGTDVEEPDIEVTGGTFKGTVSSNNVTGFIAGGTFSGTVAENLLADGCELDESGKVVPAEDSVAAIGSKGYASLEAAVEAAKGGETITLLDNIVLDGTDKGNTEGILTINKDITIDGNNKTITAQNVTVDGTNGPSMINIQDGAKVTVKNLTIDGKEVGEGATDNTKHGLNVYGDETTVIVENVTIRNGNGYGIVVNGAQATINELKTSGNGWGGINVDSKSGAASLTINDADISEDNSVKLENGASGTNADPDVKITGGTFEYITKGEEISEPNLTISGGTFATGTFNGAVDIAEYVVDGMEWDSSTGKVVEESQNQGGSSGGGGGSSVPGYIITVEDADHGSVSVSPSRADKGDTVTVTVEPDAGYELGKLSVTDGRGDRVDVERQSDTRYTFEMPSGRVTVEAVFVEITEEPTPEPTVLPFTDVRSGDWFYDAVVYVYENGMMNGVGDRLFSPNETTTRAMIVTMLYRLENEPAAAASSFTDVPAGQWYTDAVAWAASNAIVGGYGNGLFGPNDAITREQMAAILYRYAQFKGYDVSSVGDLSRYTDAGQVSAWAQSAMGWANAQGLITGNTATTLNPTASATRAEVATILMRFVENVAK